MENKVIQKIYIKSDESNETVKKEYTISELKELIAPTVMINLYYAALKPNYWFWQIKTDKIKGEIWRKCKHHNKYEASNYGRIRRILDAGKYEILEQYEEKKQKYTTSALSASADARRISGRRALCRTARLRATTSAASWL
jgi:membrane-associated HD superfamily phosphohydrolase